MTKDTWITAKMKRIIDIEKLQERQKKQKSNYWQHIKNDPVKFGHYKEWRKQYVNEKKEALSPPPIAAVPFEKVRDQSAARTASTSQSSSPTSSSLSPSIIDKYFQLLILALVIPALIIIIYGIVLIGSHVLGPY